jgi:hypothetical protein
MYSETSKKHSSIASGSTSTTKKVYSSRLLNVSKGNKTPIEKPNVTVSTNKEKPEVATKKKGIVVNKEKQSVGSVNKGKQSVGSVNKGKQNVGSVNKGKQNVFKRKQDDVLETSTDIRKKKVKVPESSPINDTVASLYEGNYITICTLFYKIIYLQPYF